jgi:hypothetical protein
MPSKTANKYYDGGDVTALFIETSDPRTLHSTAALFDSVYCGHVKRHDWCVRGDIIVSKTTGVAFSKLIGDLIGMHRRAEWNDDFTSNNFRPQAPPDTGANSDWRICLQKMCSEFYSNLSGKPSEIIDLPVFSLTGVVKHIKIRRNHAKYVPKCAYFDKKTGLSYGKVNDTIITEGLSLQTILYTRGLVGMNEAMAARVDVLNYVITDGVFDCAEPSSVTYLYHESEFNDVIMMVTADAERRPDLLDKQEHIRIEDDKITVCVGVPVDLMEEIECVKWRVANNGITIYGEFEDGSRKNLSRFVAESYGMKIGNDYIPPALSKRGIQVSNGTLASADAKRIAGQNSSLLKGRAKLYLDPVVINHRKVKAEKILFSEEHNVKYLSYHREHIIVKKNEREV